MQIILSTVNYFLNVNHFWAALSNKIMKFRAHCLNVAFFIMQIWWVVNKRKCWHIVLFVLAQESVLARTEERRGGKECGMNLLVFGGSLGSYTGNRMSSWELDNKRSRPSQGLWPIPQRTYRLQTFNHQHMHFLQSFNSLRCKKKLTSRMTTNAITPKASAPYCTPVLGLFFQKILAARFFKVMFKKMNSQTQDNLINLLSKFLENPLNILGENRQTSSPCVLSLNFLGLKKQKFQKFTVTGFWTFIDIILK